MPFHHEKERPKHWSTNTFDHFFLASSNAGFCLYVRLIKHFIFTQSAT